MKDLSPGAESGNPALEVANKTKNRFYAWATARGRGIVGSWAECEAKVSGKQARYKGFVDRASAEAWLKGGAIYAGKNKDGPAKVYAFRTETQEGIADSWRECEWIVKGQKARYRGFETRAAAQRWLDEGAAYEDRDTEKSEALSKYPDDSVFFDSGTGPGRGAEIKVTDRAGVPLVHLAKKLVGELTPEGTVVLGKGRTNNYGELTACLVALQAAEVLESKHVYGDSKLVLDYWSKGHVSRDKKDTDPELANLARQCATERKKFEKRGGNLGHVPGRFNPADLGFHRE
jgi:ribonuclease HI